MLIAEALHISRDFPDESDSRIAALPQSDRSVHWTGRHRPGQARSGTPSSPVGRNRPARARPDCRYHGTRVSLPEILHVRRTLVARRARDHPATLVPGPAHPDRLRTSLTISTTAMGVREQEMM